MKHLIAKIKELEARDFDVVASRGSLALHQTQRNQAKAEIIEAFYTDLKESLGEAGYGVYQTANGPIVEFLHEGVENQITERGENLDIYSGFISIQFDAVMKNLDTSGPDEEVDYLAVKAEKERKAREREAAKQAKIQRDAELRAEKARIREEEMTRVQILREQKADEDK